LDVRSLKILAVGIMALWPLFAAAQSTSLALSGFEFESSTPVEVTADSLAVDQNTASPPLKAT
jgi:lipopolysaccharide export system protein LptA